MWEVGANGALIVPKNTARANRRRVLLFRDMEAWEARRRGELELRLAGKSGSRVPNQPLRQAFERSGLGYAELAWRLGWTKEAWSKYTRDDGTTGVYGPFINADGSRVMMKLGLLNTSHGFPQREVTVATALEICQALGLFPLDIGL